MSVLEVRSNRHLHASRVATNMAATRGWVRRVRGGTKLQLLRASVTSRLRRVVAVAVLLGCTACSTCEQAMTQMLATCPTTGVLTCLPGSTDQLASQMTGHPGGQGSFVCTGKTGCAEDEYRIDQMTTFPFYTAAGDALPPVNQPLCVAKSKQYDTQASAAAAAMAMAESIATPHQAFSVVTTVKSVNGTTVSGFAIVQTSTSDVCEGAFVPPTNEEGEFLSVDGAPSQDFAVCPSAFECIGCSPDAKDNKTATCECVGASAPYFDKGNLPYLHDPTICKANGGTPTGTCCAAFEHPTPYLPLFKLFTGAPATVACLKPTTCQQVAATGSGKMFTTSPIPLADVKSVVPLGHLKPVEHTWPSDHNGFYTLKATAAQPGHDPQALAKGLGLQTKVVVPGAAVITDVKLERTDFQVSSCVTNCLSGEIDADTCVLQCGAKCKQACAAFSGAPASNVQIGATACTETWHPTGSAQGGPNPSNEYHFGLNHIQVLVPWFEQLVYRGQQGAVALGGGATATLPGTKADLANWGPCDKLGHFCNGNTQRACDGDGDCLGCRCEYKASIPVAAGTHIGWAGSAPGGGGIDFGATDFRPGDAGAAAVFADPNGPEGWAFLASLATTPSILAATSPFLEYPISGAPVGSVVQNDFRAKLAGFDGPNANGQYPPTYAPSTFGAVLQDVPGTIQGLWLHKGSYEAALTSGTLFGLWTPALPSENPNLALVHLTTSATKLAISVGKVPELGLAEGLLLTFEPTASGCVNRAFDANLADGGIYCFDGGTGESLVMQATGVGVGGAGPVVLTMRHQQSGCPQTGGCTFDGSMEALFIR